jgi:hypothetical protein
VNWQFSASHSPAFRAQNDAEPAILLERKQGLLIVEMLSDLLVKGLLVRPRCDVHERFVIVELVRIHVPGDVGEIRLAQCLAQKLPDETRSILDRCFGPPERKKGIDMFLFGLDPPMNQDNDPLIAPACPAVPDAN